MPWHFWVVLAGLSLMVVILGIVIVALVWTVVKELFE